MKKLKFKCWDKQNNEMDTVDYLAWHNYELYIKPCSYQDEFTLEDYDLLMYIGLMDITDREIYEQDIIRIIEPSTRTRIYCVVVYNEESCCFQFLGIRDNTIWPISFYKYCKILGNTYKDKDLYDAIKLDQNIDKWD